MRFTYQVLLALFIGAILAPIVMNIRWSAFPEAFSAYSQNYGTPVVATRQYATDDANDPVRIELKESALAAGRQALAKPCSPEARRAYRDSLVNITRQFVADMGCLSMLFCDLDSKAGNVFRRYYSSGLDRQISRQLIQAVERGAIGRRDLGLSEFLIGHPDELPKVVSTFDLHQFDPSGANRCPSVGGAS